MDINEKTHRIAHYGSFYPTPYLSFPKDYKLETLCEWMQGIAEFFTKLHDIKFIFENPATPQQLKLNSVYYGLRDSFAELSSDLRKELLPTLHQLFQLEDEEDESKEA